MAVAADVPGRYDVVINGEGYVFADLQDVLGEASYSPTFVPRTHVQGDYGDNAQAFWLTWTQRDWSLGEQQKFYRDEGASRFWANEKTSVRVPGQVTLEWDSTASTLAATIDVVCPYINEAIIAVSSTNLFTQAPGAALVDKGAHGLGVAPTSVVFDGDDVYLSSTASGTVGVRKWDGSAFSTFSATPSDELAFLNNTLYGVRKDTTLLQKYDTAGTASTLHTWKDAAGGVARDSTSKTSVRLMPWGGKLLTLWTGLSGRTTLWVYDGEGVSVIAEFPGMFYGWDLAVADGVVFVSGTSQAIRSTFKARPTIYYIVSGQLGLLWESVTEASPASIEAFGHPALTPFRSGLVFNDDTTGKIMFYNPRRGGVHAIASYTVSGSEPRFASGSIGWHFFHSRKITTPLRFPAGTGAASEGFVYGSLVDFNSSLDKVFRGVTADFVSATDGNGGSIDIAYRLTDVDDTSYTTLVTGATSGTEHKFSNVTGRAISIRVKLNKGTSTLGPVLKRVHLRAAPVQDTFRKERYVLDLSGRDGKHHVQLRDGSPNPKDGLQQATDLKTAITSTTPITIVDEFGSYTGILDPEGCQFLRVRPNEYIAIIQAREV